MISLKPRGTGGRGSSSAGEWEQWPDQADTSSPDQGNEDDDLQRAIAASLADPNQGVHVDQWLDLHTFDVRLSWDISYARGCQHAANLARCLEHIEIDIHELNMCVIS